MTGRADLKREVVTCGAQSNDLSEATLRKFLSTLHRNIGRDSKMPNRLLADFQIDEIVAYLLSLKDGQCSSKF
jgi:hypothetical protein